MYKNSYFEEIRNTIQKNDSIYSLKDCSILITGANGLICSAIVDFLIYLNEYENANINIYVASRNEAKIKKRFMPYFSNKNMRFVSYDANQPFTFSEKVDFVIHGASNAHPAAYEQEPVETMLSNFYGTYELLEYIKNEKTGRFLLISSSEVYGLNERKKLFTEEDYGYSDILNYRSCYPSSKRAAETLCASFQKEYNVDSVIVRPGHIYGPTATNEDTRASAQFINKAINKQHIVMKSSGMQIRSYCHAFDCASAILLVLLKGASGEAYNISNKNSVVSIREFAETVAHCVNQKIVFENPSTTEKESYNPMNYSALDSRKIESLGWKGYYDLRAGIEQTLETLCREE